MPSYELSISVELRADEEERLKKALRIQGSQSSLEALERLAHAATEEWLDKILARRLPPRIKDAREVRLLHYALHVDGGRLPRPEQIGDLFHLTATESKTLHRNTRTRYAFELEQGVLSALGDALEAGTWVEGSGGAKGYVRIHMDQALFEFAELQLSSGRDDPVPRISKDENYDDYRVALTSLRVLCRACDKNYEDVFRASQVRAENLSGKGG